MMDFSTFITLETESTLTLVGTIHKDGLRNSKPIDEY